MATTTNFGWDTPDDTDLVKDGAAAIRTLGSSIDTSLVDLKGGTTGQVLAKSSGTDLDYSWVAIDPLVILDAKGDLITATAADTPARLAVGADGSTLVANSAAATGLAWAGNYSAGKNLLLNGDTAIWQRGNSATSNNAYVFCADRLRIYTASSQTWSKTTDAPSNTNLNYCVANGSSVATWYFVASVELIAQGVSQFTTSNLTFSFYGKFDNGRSVSVQSYYSDDTLGQAQTATLGSTTVTGTGSWARYSLSINPTLVAAAGTSRIMRLMIFDGSGTSSTTVRITGLQLEIGSVATAFQTATGTLAGELAACRYYYKRNTAGAAYGAVLASGQATNTTSVIVAFADGPMRVAPNVVEFSNIGIDDASTVIAITSAGNSSQTSAAIQQITVGVTGATAQRFYKVSGNNNSAGYIAVSSEL